MTKLEVLQAEVVGCRRCARLVEHCTHIAEVKRRAYRDQTYWGKPVPSFGDPNAQLLIVGLAPGAHGANRTGRMFTGDSSGDFLYNALHRTGFANQPTSRTAGDGLRLIDAYITASAHCAPPQNKLTPEEVANCRTFLNREVDLLPNVRVVVCLGKLAFDNYLSILRDRGVIRSRAAFAFGHNEVFKLPHEPRVLIASYHPSQQNTLTGKLTECMFVDVFQRARTIIHNTSIRGVQDSNQVLTPICGFTGTNPRNI